MKCVDVECNFSRKRNAFMLLWSILTSPYTIVSHKFTRVLIKKQLGSRQRQSGKTAIVKAEAYIESMDRKTTVYRLEAAKIVFLFFEKCVQAVHSNVFLYFMGLPVSSSLYRRYSSRAGLHDTVQSPCDTV